MKVVLTVLLILSVLLGAATAYFSRPLFDEQIDTVPADALRVLPADTALTFARVGLDGRPLLITAATNDAVQAIDLSVALGQSFDDPIDVLQTVAYADLAALAGAGATFTVRLETLGLPFDPAYPHIAAGTNFRAHAEEVYLDDGPFLFPKLSQPTAWNASVPLRTRLDYEAELCAVTLDRYLPSRPARLGFVLCNDFTDRWTLVRDIDLDAPMGRTGFPDAKGGAGMLPIGPFLVVPADDGTFHESVTLGLALNEGLRQRTSGGLMIWSPHEIATRALADCDAEFQQADGVVGMTDCGGIPPATLLLTGTPGGVLFHVANLWYPGSYLAANDTVLTWASHLGLLVNPIR